MQTLESFLELTNANLFLKEFSFAQNNFSPQPEKSLELADHIVWIKDQIIIYQLKERIPDGPMSAETEIRWFQNKVLKKAKTQVRDTLNYLNSYPNIAIKNQRNHSFTISKDQVTQIAKIILYAVPYDPPQEFRDTKHLESSTSGFIHIINVLDYIGICQSLITPAEIWEYFDFRETVIRKWPERASRIKEQALVGQFLSGELDFWPEAHYESYLTSHSNDLESFNIMPFLNGLQERLTPVQGAAQGEFDYYKILREFAQLNRADLRALKERLLWCLKTCQSGEMTKPSRIAVPRTNCGFVFIPVPAEFRNDPLSGMIAITRAAKYEDKMAREVGTAISYNKPYFDMLHCFLEFPWATDPELEQEMRESPILRTARFEIAQRYKFD
ncbi:hypothetical protein [Corallococcus exiguus]|uniref:Uncharacterized protein n=1 Tax=Corallococcus exiguus TaxID=83462 RepID=A0A7X4Y9I5_9BACT|nr:hypothetical protein [Corallococcus exiguus]NBC41405.1 hypothetical protein [Corallococcus exiguus]TNV67112.1 hypothetical protein FH620_02475 [Corallococcus exiguus]